MTFTYDLSSPTDLTRVRFQLLDIDADEACFQDEDITFALDEAGSVPLAVRMLLEAEQRRAAMTPDFTADWLKVESQKAVANLDRVLDAQSTTVQPTSDTQTKVVFLKRYKGD